MKTRLLGLAVVLVAMAFIINALALTSADITGTTLSASIVNSSAALIAIDEGPSQDNDISFTDGTNASISIPGIQANSAYAFGQAFMVKNNSADDLYIDVIVTGGSGATLTLVSSPADTDLLNMPVTAGNSITFTMSVSAGNIATPNSTPFQIEVKADKAP
jgi:hypothetical protein